MVWVWVLIRDVVCWVASFWLGVICGIGFIDCSIGWVSAWLLWWLQVLFRLLGRVLVIVVAVASWDVCFAMVCGWGCCFGIGCR